MKNQKGRKGQVLVEYMLMLFMVVSIVGAISFGLRRTIKRFWGQIIMDVANPSPMSQPDNQYRIPGT